LAPKNEETVEALRLPFSHRLRMRNWNFAMGPVVRTASTVATSWSTATPLRLVVAAVAVDMKFLSFVNFQVECN
jgi:hypothetical protein